MSETKNQPATKAYGITVYFRIREVEQVMDLLVCECECQPEPQTHIGVEN